MVYCTNVSNKMVSLGRCHLRSIICICRLRWAGWIACCGDMYTCIYMFYYDLGSCGLIWHSKLIGGVLVHQLQNWPSRPKYAQIEEHGNIPVGASSFLLSWLWHKRSCIDDTVDLLPKSQAPWWWLDFTISGCMIHNALLGTGKGVFWLSMLCSTLAPLDWRSL